MRVAMGGDGALLADALAELVLLSVEPFDVTAMVHVACDRARGVFDADGVALLLSVDGETLELAGHAGVLGDESKRSGPADRPCLDVLRTGEPHLFSAEVVDAAYPGYAGALREMGIQSTATVPLRHAGTVIGTLVFIRTDGVDFDADTIENGQRLADVVAASIVKEQTLRAARAVSAQLEHALQARVVVEQAKGMVAAELGVSIAMSLEMIRQFARRHHLRLADVALDIVERKLPIALVRVSG
jgi:GAF domain-containing protein